MIVATTLLGLAEKRRGNRKAVSQMPEDEPTCELDPITWDAMVDAMKTHGVREETIGRVCADALASINATPEAERTRLNAQAAANYAKRMQKRANRAR